MSIPDLPELHTHGATRDEAAAMADEAIAVWLAADRQPEVLSSAGSLATQQR